MDNWNVEGTRVQHVLSGWIGIVRIGKRVDQKLFDEIPVATVQFWDSEKKEFVQLDCVEEEIREPIY